MGSQTVVYFSSKQISILQGKTEGKNKRVSVLNNLSASMPEGAVVNGVIMDEESLAAAFESAKQSFGSIKSATLVLDSTHIIYRLSLLPKVPDKEMRKLIKNEFINRDMTDKEYIYDYAILNTGRGGKKQHMVICCAVDNAIIDTYKAFFTRVGVKLLRVDFSMNAVLHALASQTDIFAMKENNDGELICIVDHYIISLINITKSGEIFFHRTRIISDENSGNYFNEIGDVIYSYQQGRKSVKRNENIKTLYLLDGNVFSPTSYHDTLMRLEFENISFGLVKLMEVDGITEGTADSFVYNICACAAFTKKNLNLSLSRQEKKVPVPVKLIIALSPIAAVALIAAVYLIGLYSDTRIMQLELDMINLYLNSPKTVADLSEYDDLLALQNTASSVYASLAEYEAKQAEWSILDGEVVFNALSVLSSRTAVSHLAYSSDSGMLTFSCSADYPDEVSQYVSSLRDTGMFYDITYQGYSRTGIGGGYVYTIACHVKEVKADAE